MLCVTYFPGRWMCTECCDAFILKTQSTLALFGSHSHDVNCVKTKILPFSLKRDLHFKWLNFQCHILQDWQNGHPFGIPLHGNEIVFGYHIL